jgi:Cu+-exporting ATPase
LEHPVRLTVAKGLATSYLAGLWERDALRAKTAGPGTSDGRPRLEQLTDRLSRWFTPLIIVIALTAAALWWPAGPARALEILTAVLIVACPCGLALAAPFALGHALRRFDRLGLHLRDTGAIERLAALDTLVFDKTGTLTAPGAGAFTWHGEQPSAEDRAAAAAVAAGSAHPASRMLAGAWGGDQYPLANDLHEHTGAGIEGYVESARVRIGAPNFCGVDPALAASQPGTWVRMGERVLGRFTIAPALREGVSEALQNIAASQRGHAPRYRLELLSGDQPTDRDRLAPLFPPPAELRFGVTPHDKLARVEALQAEGRTVGMFGDGLNDAGALAAADAGLAVADDLSGYFPASDGVLEAHAMGRLPIILRYARAMRSSVWIAIGVSFAYNLVGLSFAVTGHLTPLVAAILMPISSLTVATLGLALAALRAPHDAAHPRH